MVQEGQSLQSLESLGALEGVSVAAGAAAVVYSSQHSLLPKEPTDPQYQYLHQQDPRYRPRRA